MSPYENFIRVQVYDDASKWRETLENLEKEKPNCWDIFVHRQTQDNHKHTKHIPLVWDEEPTSLYPYFKHLIDSYKEVMHNRYGQGYFEKMIITKQEPESIIYRHRDTHMLFQRCHRCHLVLYTGNSETYGTCLFYIGEVNEDKPTQKQHTITDRWISETVPMCADEIWEVWNKPFNKYLKHSVINYHHSIHKVHLISDWKQNEELYKGSFGKEELYENI